jgi:ribosomal protein RSM22 (predicted rRNA methylase)
MMELGQRLAQSSEWPPLAHASWYHQNLSQSLPKAEMALLSYLIGEMNPFERKLLFARLWDTGVDLVVVIEPGTPDGYRRILEVREWALAQGAYLVAPCPNHKACPMKGSDWCHFPARVERSKIHKWLKSGSMGYEDEKFSYLAFGREPVSLPIGRIVGKPIKATGVVRFPLCSEGSLQDALVSRKQGGYKKARDAKWGDLLINK